MKRFSLILVSLLCFLNIYAQTYKTEPLSTEIHTIQVNKAGYWLSSPIIELNNNDYVLLNFDRISENSLDRLRYKIVHCNADWTPSTISDIDYIDGFNDNLIENYASSVNTTIEYTNFQLEIPNNDIRLKLSGNYTILVYEENNTDNILLTACFSVLDQQVAISGNVSSNTLIDSNKSHHQISFVVNHQDINIRSPFDELKTYVKQNGRSDNQKNLIKPTFVQPHKLIYEQNRALIFEAGNEYRRFEMVSHRYNGMRVLHTEYRRPYYYSYVVPDIFRSDKRYIYDQDQNGRFLIRNSEVNDSDSGADYFFTRLTLQAEEPILGNVYINGNFTNGLFNDRYQMEYDFDDKEYYTTLMLKQGVYNYQYLVEEGDRFLTAPIEGDYFETKNEYQILIYYRPMGQRYDSFIGYLLLE